MKLIEFITRLLLFVFHIVALAVSINWAGEYISQPVNILLVLAAAVLISVLIILLIYHAATVVKSFQNLIKPQE